MTAIVLLVGIVVLVLASATWLARMIYLGDTIGNPPRHAEDSWSVDGLPNHPFAHR